MNSDSDTICHTVALERIWKWGEGAPVRPERKWGTGPALGAGKKFFFLIVPSSFGSKNTISRFGERFRDGHNSLVSFLFAVFLLTVPPRCPALCKSWGNFSKPNPIQSINSWIQSNPIHKVAWESWPNPIQSKNSW